jgi:acetyl-CoA carboxylase biotin carboxyl carrier protein
VTSPGVGLFRKSEPPLEIGASVKKGQVLGAVEALRVPSEVRSPRDGMLRAILAEDGQGVEFGQALFEIE